jgi:hypothetical protein
MFFEKRVYQGSSGKVYPNPITDCVSNERSEKAYKAIFLENEYLYLMVLPEIGGRIHIGQDKTNGYDFFYRQNVIKPALVGLLGPWRAAVLRVTRGRRVPSDSSGPEAAAGSEASSTAEARLTKRNCRRTGWFRVLVPVCVERSA